MTVWLSLETFRELCFELAASATWIQQEPIPDFDTRFPGRLESCLETPQQTFGGQLLYPTLIEQAAILFYLLNKNHPFQNGNKRIALTALSQFLFLNGKWFSVDHDELHRFTIDVASSEARSKDQEIEEIKSFLRAHLIDLSPPQLIPRRNYLTPARSIVPQSPSYPNRE